MFFNNWDTVTCQFRSVRGTWRALHLRAHWLGPRAILLQWLFSVDLVEVAEDGVPEALRVPSCLTWMLCKLSFQRRGKALFHASEVCWKNKTKPHRFLAWAFWISLQRETGMPKLRMGRELRPNCSQQGYVTMLSHIDPGDILPSWLCQKVTPPGLLGTEFSVSVCGSLCWGHGLSAFISCCYFLPGQLPTSASGSPPQEPSGDFNLIIFEP